MKKLFIALTLIFSVALSTSALDYVVAANFDDDPLCSYYCTTPQAFDSEPPFKIEGAEWYVIAYKPSNITFYYIQFSNYQAALKFCNGYRQACKRVMGESTAEGYCSAARDLIDDLMKKTTKKYFANADYYEDGILIRFSSILVKK